MKKLFFLIAATALLVACNKNNGNEPTTPTQDDPSKKQDTTVVITKNVIVDQFKEIIPFQGMTKQLFEAAMQGAGWTKYEGTEVYGKTTANTTSELTYTTNSSDVVYKVTLSIRPNKSGTTYEANLSAAHVKDFVSKTGSNCELGADKINCRFYAAYTSLGQKVSSSTNDFVTFFNEGNLNGVSVYYLDNNIENWNPESTTPYVGVIMGVRNANPIEGSSTYEFNIAFDFEDMTKQ